MIIVFVVDTSPSMSRPVAMTEGGASGGRSLTRLDLAKMAVEDLSRRLRKGLAVNLNLPADPAMARSLANMGQAGAFVPYQDSLLLLSTSSQFPDTATCAAGGRLLIGFAPDDTSEVSSSVGVIQNWIPLTSCMPLFDRIPSNTHSRSIHFSTTTWSRFRSTSKACKQRNGIPKTERHFPMTPAGLQA